MRFSPAINSKRIYQKEKKKNSRVDHSFPVVALHFEEAVQKMHLQMDLKRPNSASASVVEGIEADTGEATWTSCLAAACTVVVGSLVAGIVVAAAVVASSFAAVVAASSAAGAAEPSWPSARWWMVLCCLTLRTDHLR